MDKLRRYQVIATALLWGLAFETQAQSSKTPAITLRLGKDFGSLQITNDGPPVSLSSTIKVEQQIRGVWQDARVTNLSLTEHCTNTSTPRCPLLAAGSRMLPVAWTGRYCASQCPTPCNLDGALPAGTYRFVVTTCDHKYSVVSPKFQRNSSPETK